MARMPDYIREALTDDLIELLSEDGHCISFPCNTSLQVRVSRDGNQLKDSFSYSKNGGYLNTMKIAIARCNEFRSSAENAIGHSRNHKDYIHYMERIVPKNLYTEYQYRVYYTLEGKQKSKTFSFGYRKPSVMARLHGFKTARLFRLYYVEYGEEIVDHFPFFRGWKDRKLYEKGHPFFDWQSF